MQPISLVLIAFISLSIGIAASRSFSQNVLRNYAPFTQSPVGITANVRNGVLVTGIITSVSPLSHTLSLAAPDHYSTGEDTVLTVGFDDATAIYEKSSSSTAKAILGLIGLPVRANIATRNGPLYAIGLRTITADQ